MHTKTELLQSAIDHHQHGRLEQAASIYQRLLEQDPNQPDAWHLLGVIARQTGHVQTSVELIERAIRISGDSAVACGNLAIAYHDLGQFTKAVDYYRRSLNQNPNNEQTLLNLGVALKNLGHINEAISCYRQAFHLKPDCVPAINNLGIELQNRKQFAEALVYFRQALAISPSSAEIHNNLGNCLKEIGQLDSARESFHRAIELNPVFADAWNNLGNVLKDQARLVEAIAAYQRAVELNPQFVVAHSNLIYTQLFHVRSNSPNPLSEHDRWNQQHLRFATEVIRPHDNDRSTERRLRIGYVSPDFCDHCQTLFTAPLFRAHDQTKFEIVCYSDVADPDYFTRELRGSVHHWDNIIGLSDDQVAAVIRHDQIDILVDLTLHMAGHRLRMFARKPAPVQVCWLAYPGTSGLPAMDYRLTDCYLDPPDQDDLAYREESIRLPESFWCYDPFDRKTSVSPLPALSNGFITFGCLNNFCKLNVETLQSWARVLNAVDRSRLVVLAHEGSHRDWLLETLRDAEVTADRISFFAHKPRSEYLRYYDQIDIGLDTLPYNGHTTSLDSYWMGVPVVTCVGKTVVGRAGLSQLTNLGLTELIAQDEDQFVAIVADLAQNLERLSKLRATLRDQLRASPLMNANRFARHVEATYRQIWKRWCRTGK